MPERRENPIKRIINEVPAVREILGSALILGGTLGGGYCVKDGAEIFWRGITWNIAEELDKNHVPLPETWVEAYRVVHLEEIKTGIKFAVDFGGLIISGAGLVTGYEMLKNRTPRRYKKY